MKKIVSLILTLVLCFGVSSSAFAETLSQTSTPIIKKNVLQKSTASGSAFDTFKEFGYLYINMRETNKSVDVRVQIVSSKASDFEHSYYVAWTTPSNKVYILGNVFCFICFSSFHLFK